MKLYVIYDRAAEECGPVVECANDAVAQRMYKTSFMKEMAGQMDEFWLYCVGEKNNQTMVITPGIRRIEMNFKGEVEDGK